MVCHSYICSVKNVILFIAVMMLTKPLWPVVEYFAQYDYIVSTLCENKDKPDLECNGKCYLGKQLAKEMGDNDNPFNQVSKTEIPQFIIFEILPNFEFNADFEISNVQYFECRPNFYLSPYSLQVLHPPRLG